MSDNKYFFKNIYLRKHIRGLYNKPLIWVYIKVFLKNIYLRKHIRGLLILIYFLIKNRLNELYKLNKTKWIIII